LTADTGWAPDHRNQTAAMIMAKDGDAVLDFVQAVFGAEIVGDVLRRADGSLWNVSVRLGDGMLMIATGEQGFTHTAFTHVYVPDCDAVVKKALGQGASEMMPVGDQFYGDRAGGVQDPQGNIWWIATHKETLTGDALVARARAFEAEQAGGDGGHG